MEPWQKEYITSNLVDLMEGTTVNAKLVASLQAENILAKGDVEQLGRAGGPSDVSKLLYNILETRSNSYEAIGKAAFKTRQTGLFQILLMGLVKHILYLNNIDMQDDTLREILKKHCREKDTLRFFLHKTGSPTLFEDSWIPSPSGEIYLLRQISNRVKVDQTLFQEECSEIFVFKGMNRSQLSKLAEPNRTVLSGEAILRKSATVRFVLLEREKDWDELILLWSVGMPQMSANNNESRSVHLIQYDKTSNEFILLRSIGSNELISNHIAHDHRDRSLYVTEDQFLSEVATTRNRTVVCICDIPGMGKTRLLENLARGTHNSCPKHIVAFIRLSEFCQSNNLLPTERNMKDFEMNSLLGFLSSSRLIQDILREILRRHETQLELFLDGFDEISREHLESSKQFFGKIASSEENVRLFITSRPHMRQNLEKTFQAVSFDILPFSEESQIEYLVGYWKAAAGAQGNLQEDKLITFATACLKVLKKSLTKEEGDLMGIPLQCHLLAAVNLSNAISYCSRNDAGDAINYVSPSSMDDMYNRYVNMGLNRATGVGDSPEPENTEKTGDDILKGWPKFKFAFRTSSTSTTRQRQKLKSFHVWKALQQLYPSLAEDYFGSEKLSHRDPTDSIFACGLLQIPPANRKGSVTFLHRTFAEFLVAELFAQIFSGRHKFRNNKILQKFLDVFFHNIVYMHLHTAPSPVMLNFVNSSLSRQNFERVPLRVATESVKLLEDTSPSNILKAAIQYSHGYIVRLLKFLLCGAYKGKAVPPEVMYCSGYKYQENSPAEKEHQWSWREYLCTAAIYSDVAMVEELYRFYEECFGENLNEICDNMPTTEESPLQNAIQRRNYDLVEYFSGRISLSRRNLLLYCVTDTHDCSREEVKVVIDICELLLGKCGPLLNEKDPQTMFSPLFSTRVHVELVKFLVRRGADLQASPEPRKNLVTWHFKEMRKNHFRELCRFLIFETRMGYLFLPNVQEWRDPLHEIIGGINVATLNYIAKIPGINFHVLDQNKNNLILQTILRDGNVDVVEFLLGQGVNLHHNNRTGQRAVHVAVRRGNIGFVKYFLNKGISLKNLDNNGNAPLHYAHTNLEMVKYLLSQNVNIHAVNKDGDNIAHRAANFVATSDDVVAYLLSLTSAHSLFRTQNCLEHAATDILFRKRYFPQIKSSGDAASAGVMITKANCYVLFVLAIESEQRKEVFQQLITDPLCDNQLKRDALHLVTKSGNLKTTQHLVSLGLSLEFRDYEGNTPLLVAGKSQELEVAKYLISQKADPLVVDKNSNNIAHFVPGIMDLAGRSLTRGQYHILFTGRNYKGRTPLHHWIKAGVPLNGDMINKVMHIAGGGINEVDNLGQTMFLTAVARNYEVEVLNCLWLLGANPYRLDNKGQNALHIAAKMGHSGLMIRYLEGLGVFPDLPDNKGYTARQIIIAARELRDGTNA